jgi:hypothetical protein
VVANLDLYLEAGTGVERHLSLEGVDPGLTIGPEEPVQSHYHRAARGV